MLTPSDGDGVGDGDAGGAEDRAIAADADNQFASRRSGPPPWRPRHRTRANRTPRRREFAGDLASEGSRAFALGMVEDDRRFSMMRIAHPACEVYEVLDVSIAAPDGAFYQAQHAPSHLRSPQSREVRDGRGRALPRRG